jgi:hypothetical protein
MSESQVIAYMRNNVADFSDLKTGRVDYTLLAEETWEHFRPDYSMPTDSIYYQYAKYVAIEFQSRLTSRHR